MSKASEARAEHREWARRDGHGLTPAQTRVLEAVRRLTSDGWPAAIREIGVEAGLTSTSTVHLHLHSLQALGLIEHCPRNPKLGWKIA